MSRPEQGYHVPAVTEGITRRQVLAGSAGLAGILALRQAPAFAQTREIRLLKAPHFVPTADAELKRQGEEWGRQNRATFVIDAVPTGQLNSKKAAVVTAQAGGGISAPRVRDHGISLH